LGFLFGGIFLLKYGVCAAMRLLRKLNLKYYIASLSFSSSYYLWPAKVLAKLCITVTSVLLDFKNLKFILFLIETKDCHHGGDLINQGV
jgi:hypothetical protein